MSETQTQGRTKASFDPETQVTDPHDLWVPPAKEGVPVAGRVDKSEKAIMQEAVQSGVFAFKTESDVVRAACHWFLAEQVVPRMRNQLFLQDIKRQTVLIRAAQAGARTQETQKFCRQIREALNTLLKVGAEDQALQIWYDTWSTANAASEPFKTTVKEWLKGNPELLEIRRLAMRREEEGNG